MGKKLERLSYTLRSIFRARGLQGRLSEYRILGKWEETVGEVIARHAWPLSVRGNKLYLAVDSAAWMQQLSMLKPEIIEKVNRNLGREAVKDIVLNLGEIPSSGTSPRQPELPVELSREEVGKIEACLKDISDADVRQAVRRVMEKDFLSKKEKQKKMRF